MATLPSLLLLLHGSLVCPTTVTQYTPLEILVPGGDGTHQALTLQVPTTPGELHLRDPTTLHASVAVAYNAILEGAEKQSGLVDAKTPWLMNQPLHPQESWHHHTAANAGVLDSARFLITFSMAPALSTGGSPLHLAAAMNDAARIKELLSGPTEEGGSTPAVDAERESDGLTPLHFACSAGAALAARALLEGGANVEALGKNGATPLMIAASFGHLEVVKLLVLEYHANPAASHAFAGTTALHFAAEMGRGAVISFLCSEGASVSARTSAGGTPLHTAADTNQSSSLDALLAPPCKADPNTLLNGDTTPMYLAAQRGLSTIVRKLAGAGGDLDFAMPAAPYKGTLVEVGGGSGGDFDAPKPGAYYGEKNTKRGNGATALHAAVENGHADTVATLLALGALQTTAMEGASPVLLAIQYKHPHIALLLLNASGEEAQVNAQTPHDGQFPLGAATLAGYHDVVRALLARGANVSLVDHQGRTALSLAISAGKWAMAQDFIARGGLLGGSDREAAFEAAVGTRRVDALAMVLSSGSEQQGQKRGGWLNTPLLTHSSPPPPLWRVAALGWGEGCGALLSAGAVVPTGALKDRGNVFHATASVKSCGPCLKALLRSPTYNISSGLHLASAGRGGLDFATPLHSAAKGGCVEGVVELLSRGADPGATLRRSQSTPLHLAVSGLGGGGEGVVNALLDTVGESQESVLLRALDKEGRTPFHAAIASGSGGGKGLSTLFMQRLSAFNNDTRHSLVNTADAKGLTPLHTCLRSRACTPDVFHALLSLGASTKGGLPHALLGERRGKDRVGAVRTLLQGREGGGKVEGVDWDATLKTAVDTGDVELSEVVLKGLPLNNGVSKGALTAALGKAVSEGWVDMVALLVKVGGVMGEEVDLGGTGKSAREVAMEGVHIKGRGDILKILTAASEHV